MPKKKGLGRDIKKSLEAMDNLVKSLDKFSKMPMKAGLRADGIEDKDLEKAYTEAREKASSLQILVENMQEDLKSAKTGTNSRFASQRVVQKFLENHS